MAMTIDTRRAVQQLTEAGVGDPEADAIVEVVGDATSPLVTREMLRAEFAAFRTEFRADMKDLHAEFYRALWIQTGVFAAIVAAIVALLTLL